MNVLMLQPRFEEAVVSCRKPHSIRPDRRDGRPRARVGEALSLRVWTGKPYRSQQREIARAVVTEVERLAIRTDGVMWRPGSATEVLWTEQDGLLAVLLHSLAHADGFTGWEEMRDWFATTHGLPFEGSLIRWRLASVNVGAARGGSQIGIAAHDNFSRGEGAPITRNVARHPANCFGAD